MNKLLLAISLIALTCYDNANASPTEKLKFKGGVVVEGHILSQDIGKSITFAVECTKATIPGQWVTYRSDVSREYSEIAPVWKKWIKENKKESDYDDSTKQFAILELILCNNSQFSKLDSKIRKDSVTFRVISEILGNNSHQVHLLEDGASICFIDISSKKCNFKWSDIYSVEFNERDKMALNGILDIVELNNGSIYKGQIIEKVLGDRIRIKDADGMLRSVLNEDIRSIKKEGLNPDVPILHQAQYLDDVNDNVGLIICQQVNHSSPQIRLLTEYGGEKSINMEDIKTITSIENKNYKPLSDYLIEGDEAYFNDVKTPSVICKNRKDNYTLEQDSISKIQQIHLEDGKNTIDVYMSNTDLNKSAVFLPLNNIGNEKNINLSFSKDDILQKNIVAQNQSVSVHNVLHKEYKVSPGYYVLFIPKTKKGYFCMVR